MERKNFLYIYQNLIFKKINNLIKEGKLKSLKEIFYFNIELSEMFDL